MSVNKVVYNGSTLIDLTSDTATTDEVLSGYTFHTASGISTTGTMDIWDVFDNDTYFGKNRGCNRRNIFRGKNLGSTFTSTQKTAISSGAFTDMFIGDYWTDMGDGFTYYIADFDSYYNIGGILTHHLLIHAYSTSFSSYIHSSSDTGGGYYNSYMHQAYLPVMVETYFKDNFGDYIMSFYERLSSACDDDGVVQSTTVDLCSAILPSETDILGHRAKSVWSSTDPYHWRQIPYFSRYANRGWSYWLRDVGSSTGYVRIYGDGCFGVSLATSSLYVRPLFCLAGTKQS